MKTRIFVAFLLLVFSVTAYSQEPETVDKLDTLLEKLMGNDDDDFDEIKSQKLINDIQNGLIIDSEPELPNPQVAKEPSSKIPIKEFPTKVKMSETQVQDIKDAISEYLDWYKANSKTPGVELLEPKHLDWRLLIFRSFRNGGENRIQVVFGDRFHKHVAIRGAIRGRRHLLKQRLGMTAFVAGAIAATLVLLYGTLKLLSLRSKRDDYLSASQVPMV